MPKIELNVLVPILFWLDETRLFLARVSNSAEVPQTGALQAIGCVVWCGVVWCDVVWYAVVLCLCKGAVFVSI